MANWAIVIGIDSYWSADNCLNGAVTDALQMRDWLVHPQGGQVPPRNLFLLVSPHLPIATGTSCYEANQDNIVRFCRRVIQRSGGQGERFFFFYSGHGLTTTIDDRFEEVLVPSDFEPDLPHKSLLLSSIRRYFLRTSFAEQFIFVDACRNFPGMPSFYASRLTCNHGERSPLDAQQYVMYATSPGREAVESAMIDEDRGAFAHALLEGLKGGAKRRDEASGDDVVRVNDLFQYVHKKVTDQQLTVRGHGDGAYIMTPRQDGERSLDVVLARFPAQKSAPSPLPPHTLPAIQQLIGRARVVDELIALLRDETDGHQTRLLTFRGPPGVGKTSLAKLVAFKVLEDFPDGVFFIPLEQVTEPGDVLHVIGQQLPNYQPITNEKPEISLIRYLRDRKLLLVLDKFEHVDSAAGSLIPLLDHCPRLSIIVTSTLTLQQSVPACAAWETEFEVKPLSYPTNVPPGQRDRVKDFPAVQLFIERARERTKLQQPGFTFNSENAADVVAICQWFAGLPRGIELVASQMDTHTPASILEVLKDNLEPGSLPGSVDSVRGAIRACYHLLEIPEERALFRALSVFVGGCTIDAIKVVCQWPTTIAPQDWPRYSGFVPERLRSLVHRSLINLDYQSKRYHILEPFRHLGRDLLEEYDNEHGTADAVRFKKAYCRYYTEMAGSIEPRLRSSGRRQYLSQLDVEHLNLRQVLDLGLADDDLLETAAEMAGFLFWLWNFRGYFDEGWRYLEALLLRTQNWEGPVRTRLLYAAGGIRFLQGEYEQAQELLSKSLETPVSEGTDERDISLLHAYTLTVLAMTKKELNKPDYLEQAHGAVLESIRIFRKYSDSFGEALATNDLGNILAALGDDCAAKEQFESALSMWQRAGDRWGEGLTLDNLGCVALRNNQPEIAQDHLIKALHLQADTGDTWGIAWSQKSLGDVAVKMGQDQAALDYYQKSFVTHLDLGRRQLVAECLEGLAQVAGRDAEALPAAELGRVAKIAGAAQRFRTARRSKTQQQDYNKLVQLLHEGLTDVIFNEQFDAGSELGQQELLKHFAEVRERLQPNVTNPAT